MPCKQIPEQWQQVHVVIYPVRYIAYLAFAINGNAKKGANRLSNIGSNNSTGAQIWQLATPFLLLSLNIWAALRVHVRENC
jgi:hypothetical protein